MSEQTRKEHWHSDKFTQNKQQNYTIDWFNGCNITW
jgi:hypothetical protein